MTRHLLRQQACQGEATAMVALLNLALSHKQVTVEVQEVGPRLHLTLKGALLSDDDLLATLIDREVVTWRSPILQEVYLVAQGGEAADPLWEKVFALGSCCQWQVPSRPKPRGNMAGGWPRLPRARVTEEGWQALGAGLFLAILLSSSQQLRFIFSYFIILVHELGHTVLGWLFGYPSVPAFDFRYGGGVTLHQGRTGVVVGLLVLGMVGLIYRHRQRPFALGCLGAIAAVYSLCALTDIHRILQVGMGHGFELLFAMIFLYRSVSGFACTSSLERPLYGAIALFTIFYDLRFFQDLIHNPEVRSQYLYGKGGLLDHDLVVLARDYFHVDLSVVAGFFWLGCGLTPWLTLGLYRYRAYWVYGALKFLGRTGEWEG